MKHIFILFLNFKLAVFKTRLRLKIKKAERLKKQIRANYLVFTDGRRLKVYRRSQARDLVRQHKFKGVKTIEQLEKKAIYTTR